MLGRAIGNSDTQDSPWPGLGGSHHLPPYSILSSSPRGPHPNGILSWDSQVGVLEFSQLGLLRLWGPITSHADLWLRWNLKKSCSPRQEFSNGMLHATCMLGNWVDSRHLMIGSQIVNLTSSLSFGHKLCLKCWNGSCEPISDIYFSIQWVLTLVIVP